MSSSVAGRVFACVLISGLVVMAIQLRADDSSYTGTFSDGNLTVQLAAAGNGYAGKLTLGGNSYDAKATADASGLSGTFRTAGNDFPFTSTLAGNQLAFVTGGKTYTLTRQVANPLAGGANSGPAASAPATTSVGDFTLLGQTSVGKTLFLKVPSATTLESAITQTADALGKIFDGKPALSGGFAESQNKNRGGATFTAKLQGQDVRGLIFCTAAAGGAGNASAIYLRSDAPASEMASLMAFLPADTQMTTHNFPDGSGSVDFPTGWKTVDQTATYGVGVTGPGGQTVIINRMILMNDPNCSLIRNGDRTYQMQLQTYNMQLQSYQQSQNFARSNPNIIKLDPPQKPAPPDPDPNVRIPMLNFCPYCDGAAEILKVWYPISEAKAKRAGGPYSSLDKVMEVIPGEANPLIPGSASGVAYFAVTDHDSAKSTPIRVIARFATAPIAKGESWQFAITSMRAPSATFDGDVYTMNAITNSFKLNMDVVNARMQKDGAAVRKMGEDNEKALLARGRQFQEQQDQNFNRFESQMAAQEKARHDSSSDFIEYVRGVRDVYDNQSGKMLSVDLFNSNGIVNGLNAAANDPNRFVQIPLRYER
jgi:hypothetical protein